MQKTKKTGLSIFSFATLILGLITTLMIFLPSVSYVKTGLGATQADMWGILVAFGGSAQLPYSTPTFYFNWGSFLGYLLPVIAGVLAFLLTNKSKFFVGLSAFLFILSAILLFSNVGCLLATCNEHFTSIGMYENNLHLGIGSWIGGFTACFGFCACVADIVCAKLK